MPLKYYLLGSRQDACLPLSWCASMPSTGLDDQARLPRYACRVACGMLSNVVLSRRPATAHGLHCAVELGAGYWALDARCWMLDAGSGPAAALQLEPSTHGTRIQWKRAKIHTSVPRICALRSDVDGSFTIAESTPLFSARRPRSHKASRTTSGRSRWQHWSAVCATPSHDWPARAQVLPVPAAASSSAGVALHAMRRTSVIYLSGENGERRF